MVANAETVCCVRAMRRKRTHEDEVKRGAALPLRRLRSSVPREREQWRRRTSMTLDLEPFMDDRERREGLRRLVKWIEESVKSSAVVSAASFNELLAGETPALQERWRRFIARGNFTTAAKMRRLNRSSTAGPRANSRSRSGWRGWAGSLDDNYGARASRPLMSPETEQRARTPAAHSASIHSRSTAMLIPLMPACRTIAITRTTESYGRLR